jgi:hypothetical protein
MIELKWPRPALREDGIEPVLGILLKNPDSMVVVTVV